MELFLYGILIMAFIMVVTKRVTALINAFALQSLFLFLLAFGTAYNENNAELYVVAGLILLLKALLIPWFLRFISKKMQVDENLGLSVNPVLSLVIAIGLSWLAYLFADRIIGVRELARHNAFIVSLAVMLIGMFIMIFRMKALAQIAGLLVMENGLFLAATGMCGGMPFFMEIAVFFDIFICVIILGIFVYRINSLFTHIDVNKLTRLKG